MSKLAVVLGNVLFLASSARADTPPAERITVDIVTMNGTGCAPGSAWAAMWPDNTSLNVQYGDYFAGVGVGTRLTDFRKSCQLSVLVHVPPGFAYAITAVDHRAYVSLVAGASGRHRANYFFQGQPAPALVEHSFSGPLEDERLITVPRDEVDLAFSTCGEPRALQINTELRVSAGTSDPVTTTSFMVMDWVDAAGGATTYHLVWKRCSEERSSARASLSR